MTKPNIFDEPGTIGSVERRELHSRYLNQTRMYPLPMVLQWIKPAGSRVAFLLAMEEDAQ